MKHKILTFFCVCMILFTMTTAFAATWSSTVCTNQFITTDSTPRPSGGWAAINATVSMISCNGIAYPELSVTPYNQYRQPCGHESEALGLHSQTFIDSIDPTATKAYLLVKNLNNGINMQSAGSWYGRAIVGK